MSVQTFNPSDLSQSTANWAVAQRIVGPFAPHAQVTPNLTLALDPGYLLSGTTLTEVNTQNVGPFAPPASGFRIDRVVVDRSTGAASIVAGTANSLTPPAIPSGKLPVARVMLEPTTAAIANEIVVDERALVDLTPQKPLILCRATLGGTDQTSVSNGVWTKVLLSTTDYNVGSCFDTTNKRFQPAVAGYYRVTGQVSIPVASGGTVAGAIYKNGSAIANDAQVASTTAPRYVAVNDIVSMNGTSDYLELYAYRSDGVPSGSFAGGTNVTFFSADFLG